MRLSILRTVSQRRALPALVRAPRAPLSRLLSTETATGSSEPPPPPPAPKSEAVGEAQSMEFQAETKKLLNIVANSLYTDKEVFLRELISNASDALEKRRYATMTGEGGGAGEGPEMGISITTDKEANTLTIQDTGIGMSREELIQNLGTIARSGTKSFAQQLQEQNVGGEAAANVIGQFGVGFYAVFMVAEEVTVYSRKHGEEQAHCWRSTGDGAYDLSEASSVEPGTKIVMKLKSDEDKYSQRFQIEQNIRKYSNFVGFPITVDGDHVNTLDALWMKSKNEVTQDQHNEFYRYGTPPYASSGRHMDPVAAICIQWLPYASSGRHMHPLAAICIQWLPYASSGRYMYPVAAICIQWPLYAPAGRHMHPVAAICIQWPLYASSGRHMHPVAAICTRWPPYASSGRHMHPLAEDAYSQARPSFTWLRMGSRGRSLSVPLHGPQHTVCSTHLCSHHVRSCSAVRRPALHSTLQCRLAPLYPRSLLRWPIPQSVHRIAPTHPRGAAPACSPPSRLRSRLRSPL